MVSKMETIVKCTYRDCLNNYKGYCTAQQIKMLKGKCVDHIIAKEAMRKDLKHGTK